jgi:glutamine phosphoribosylpyrophosphate amidotransferase
MVEGKETLRRRIFNGKIKRRKRKNIMCSVIGYKGEYNEELLTKVFQYSRIRGLHSFGYSYYSPELITKKFLKYNEFIESINEDRPNLFIAHFRYSTSGDYIDLNNNQPLTADGVSIAFNGIISQGTKEDMEKKYDLSIPYENDGYILMKKYRNRNFIQSDITFALVGLEDGKLLALRNEKRPLWYNTDEHRTIISSTSDILKRSGVNNPTEINPYNEYLW